MSFIGVTLIILIAYKEIFCFIGLWYILMTIQYSTVVKICDNTSHPAGRPGSSEVSRNPLTRWDVSSIPANGIFLTKKLKN